MADDARRREKRQLEERRLAGERGDYDIDRGDYDIDRGDYDIDRGDYDIDRGDYDIDRGGLLGGMGGGGGANAAADIFRRAVGLGGHLVVSFVAPIGASCQTSPPGCTKRPASSDALTASARAQVAAMTEEFKQRRPRRRAP